MAAQAAGGIEEPGPGAEPGPGPELRPGPDLRPGGFEHSVTPPQSSSIRPKLRRIVGDFTVIHQRRTDRFRSSSSSNRFPILENAFS